jgi:hypothetical protein
MARGRRAAFFRRAPGRRLKCGEPFRIVPRTPSALGEEAIHVGILIGSGLAQRAPEQNTAIRVRPRSRSARMIARGSFAPMQMAAPSAAHRRRAGDGPILRAREAMRDAPVL